MTVTAIVDVNYMARRAYYSRANLELENGVIFGFLRDVAAELQFFAADTAVFCFDSLKSERMKIDPQYKCSRAERLKKMNADEYKAEMKFYEQVIALPRYLRKIGYANIFQQDGYEADDLMAACCNSFPGRKFLISADRDLFQLLTSQVSCWNPQQKKMTSLTSFQKKYEIGPDEWVSVKAIAGCGTDDITGVRGVGEKTAIKYLRRDLGRHTAAYGAIRAATARIDTNRVLVRLPFPGCRACEPQPDDNPTADGWARAARKLGIPILARLAPGGRRKRVV